GDRRIVRRGSASVAEWRVLRGMVRRAIVRVRHVASGAAAAAIVARLIVGAGKREQRIEQARLLQPEEHGIDAELGAEAAIAQLDLRPPRIIVAHRIAGLALLAAAALEDAQYVARLRDFPALQRI